MTDNIIISCTNRECLREIGEFEEVYFLHNKPVCCDCRPCCEYCGEWMDDASDENKTPLMRIREWCNDGRLSKPSHADCTADWLLSVWAGKAGLIGAEDLTRDQITALVESQIGVAA